MSILIFIVILAFLVFAHELGHFIVAKRSGIRVDEFAIGFPPTLFRVKRGETTYALNLIPFGGYVRIFGENPDEDSLEGPDSARSFARQKPYVQAMVLVAGIAANIVAAWLLISIAFMIGMPASQSVAGNRDLRNPALTITSVAPNSPADRAGLSAGDKVVTASVQGVPYEMSRQITLEEFKDLIGTHPGVPLAVSYRTGESVIKHISVVPEEGLVEDRAAIGVSLDMLGTLKLGPLAALGEGARFTVQTTGAIVTGLFGLIRDAVQGQGHVSDITGPVGIVGLVGDASRLGAAYLLSFAAFISLNLAVINLIPFPALDGGRLLFVLIESIKGSPIKPKIANAFNIAGFSLLILLMLVVTYHDIIRLIQN